MPRQDDDFEAFGDRRPHWDKAPERRFPDEATPQGASRPRSASPARSFARGCGCILVVTGALVAAVILGVRSLPPVTVLGLSWVVESAIGGSLRVNEQPAGIPEPWREPVRASLSAYVDAYEAGLVPGAHLWKSYVGVFSAVQPAPDQDAKLRAFVLHLRDGLLPEARAGLPELPPPPPTEALSSQVPGPAWDGFAFLTPDQRAAQSQKLERMAHTLSRVYGPTSRGKLLPPGAVLEDFQADALPFNEIRNAWSITTPVDGGIVFQPGETGFSDDMCHAFVILSHAADSQAVLEFTTTAGSVDFWYDFDGRAKSGSALAVSIDGQEVFRDSLPTNAPGRLATAWRHADLNDLGAGSPTQVRISVTATAVDQECTVLIDDLVFGP